MSVRWWLEIFGLKKKTRCEKKGFHLWIKDFYSFGYICARHGCTAYLSEQEVLDRGWRV